MDCKLGTRCNTCPKSRMRPFGRTFAQLRTPLILRPAISRLSRNIAHFCDGAQSELALNSEQIIGNPQDVRQIALILNSQPVRLLAKCGWHKKAKNWLKTPQSTGKLGLGKCESLVALLLYFGKRRPKFRLLRWTIWRPKPLKGRHIPHHIGVENFGGWTPLLWGVRPSKWGWQKRTLTEIRRPLGPYASYTGNSCPFQFLDAIFPIQLGHFRFGPFHLGNPCLNWLLQLLCFHPSVRPAIKGKWKLFFCEFKVKFLKKEFFYRNVGWFFFDKFCDESFSEPKVNWMWNYDSYHCESLLSNYIRYWLVVDVGPRATFQKKWGRNQKVLLVKKVVCPRL